MYLQPFYISTLAGNRIELEAFPFVHFLADKHGLCLCYPGAMQQFLVVKKTGGPYEEPSPLMPQASAVSATIHNQPSQWGQGLPAPAQPMRPGVTMQQPSPWGQGLPAPAQPMRPGVTMQHHPNKMGPSLLQCFGTVPPVLKNFHADSWNWNRVL